MWAVERFGPTGAIRLSVFWEKKSMSKTAKKPAKTEKIEKSIEISVPIKVAYDQWTQFEEFPMFMKGVKQVQQLDSKRLHWRAEIAGKEKEWDAEIIEQVPDRKVAWRSTSGARNDGMVTFDKRGEHTTLLTLFLEYMPEDTTEHVGDALGVVSHRVEGDLKRFREFIESRGVPTGAWRGEIHSGALEPFAKKQMPSH
jgi:uncharacterized membrane protein